MLLPYWDRSGVVHQLEAAPESIHDWAQGEDVPANQKGLHTAVEETLGQALIRTQCKGKDMNITLDATLEDGRSVMLRQRHTYASDPVLEKWSLGKFQNELKLLRWLRANTSIPVPNILAVGPNYTIQEKMPGVELTYRWHFLSEAAKDNLISGYVNILSELFNLSVPQKIGSASVDEVGGMGVGPLIAVNTSCSVPKVLDDISEYIDFLFTVKRRMIAEMTPEDAQRAETTLTSLATKTRAMIHALRASDPNGCVRCVLTHADFHGYNILVDNDGAVTAVLDWEVNRVQPAVLGVDYPLWLFAQGAYDPRFARDYMWWEESPAERERFCNIFEKKVQERDPEMYKCLIEGRDLRAVVGWLTEPYSSDPGFDRMRAWATSQLE